MSGKRFFPCGHTRREFLWEMGGGFAGTALAGLLAADGFFSRAHATEPVKNALAPHAGHFPGTAKNVIFLMMNGGPSQVDTFDHKPALEKYAGQPLPATLSAADLSSAPILVGTPANGPFSPC